MLLFKKDKRVFCCSIILMLCAPLLVLSETSETVKVGYQLNSDLVFDLESRGNEGIGYEQLKKIEGESNLQFEFVEIEGDIFESLRANEVDIIGLYLKTPEREAEFLYSERPFNMIISCLAIKGTQGAYYDDPESIDGKTVATYEGNPTNLLFDEYLRENKISATYIFDDFDKYLDLKADYYLTFTENRAFDNFHTVLNLENSTTYLLANKDNKVLMDEINRANSKAQAEEGFFFNELVNKYNFDAINLSHRELTRAEVEKLQEKPLLVGYADNHRPFTYTDDEGIANGAIVELMNNLAEKYKFEVEYIPYNLEEEPFSHGDFDILISVLGDTQYELQYYTPTEPYYSIPMVASVPMRSVEAENVPEGAILGASTIGIADYLYINVDKFLETLPNIQMIKYASFENLLEAYKYGGVDLAVYTSAGTTYANAYLEGSEHYLFATDFLLDFYFSVSKRIDSEYVPIFNVMLDTITVREYDSVFNAHNATYYPKETFETFLSDFGIYLFSFVIAFALVFISHEYNVQQQKKDSIIKAYQTDELTGLISISYYYERAKEVLSTAAPREFELISFDIDYFRTINSYYSMEHGTNVIIEISNSLSAALSDTSAIISRKTAEQFYILRKVGEGDPVEHLYYEYILPSIRNVMGYHYVVSLSFGSFTIDNCEENLSDIMAYADYARMSGKVSHETTFLQFDEEMKKKFKSKLHITFKMDRAIKDKEFIVVYQPKIDFKTLKIVGAEALVRWVPPTGGIIYPDDFIEVFERNGFISTLDLYVLKEVCRFINIYSCEFTIPLISVNLSAGTILKETLIMQLFAILDDYGVNPSQIELEVTETAILGAEETFLSKIKELKNLGFVVSIDDFGSGVSSLNRLCSIKADVLKLDKAFFEQKEESIRAAIIVDQVITLAKRLEMEIVAEGVETKEQAQWLRDLNCDKAQGFYFSQPMDKDSFLEQLKAGKMYVL